MPPILALMLSIAASTWLCLRDRKFNQSVSAATWIPLVWLFIVGSRPITAWFAVDSGGYETPQDLVDGSPLDAAVYTGMLAVGLCILARRLAPTWRLLSSNRALCAFLLFGLASVVWSDFPIVALKRWVKDFGNVVMILLLLTERDPVQAVRTVLLRLAYIAVPLSVVFIKYYPNLGRYVDRWSGDYFFSGIATDKNSLGPLAMVCGIVLVWNWLDLRRADPQQAQVARGDGVSQDRARLRAPRPVGRFGGVDAATHAILLAMVAWLLATAQSSTSIVCMALSACILLFMRMRIAGFARRNLGTLSILALVAGVVIFTQAELLATFSGAIGRDSTLTGRTQLWEDLLAAPVNRWIGRGFQSFWLGPEASMLWEKYYFRPNQAHNGYLETYLNGGILGLVALFCLLIGTLRNLSSSTFAGDPLAVLGYCFFVTCVVSNFTEATFNKMNLIWIVMLLATLRAAQTASRPVAVPRTRVVQA